MDVLPDAMDTSPSTASGGRLHIQHRRARELLADGLLEVISARAASGQAGAAWQRATLAAAKQGHNRQRALTVMLDRYLQYAETGMPVHTWPPAS
jgi:hypothetical protein